MGVRRMMRIATPSPSYGAGVGYPQLPQRPIPPIHHVWVAGPEDARRMYRGTVWRTPGLTRLAIIWTVVVLLAIASAVLDPTHNLSFLIIALLFPVFVVILVLRRGKAMAAFMTPGSVWASGFGANELLIVSPLSTVVIDYVALRPPRVVGPAVLIQNRQLGGWTALPLELVPPDALTFLQQRTTTAS